MEIDEFLKTPFARQVIGDSDHSLRELEDFNLKWRDFWNRSVDEFGVILISHLSVEHYLNEWLTAANPGTKPIAETRLSFAQKISLADDTRGLLRWVMPGIKRLNQIRNGIAHDLNKNFQKTI